MTPQRAGNNPSICLPAFSLDREAFKLRTETLKFGSRSEAACAFFLEIFGRGWQADEGVTWQVPAGPKRIDFFLPDANTFLEYHPIKRWDWRDSEASRKYGEHFRKLSPAMKRESWGIEKLEFARRYYDERRLILNLTGYDQSNLIVSQSANDFYRDVLRGIFAAPISERVFLREWAAFINAC